jgi:hypothetical protein
LLYNALDDVIVSINVIGVQKPYDVSCAEDNSFVECVIKSCVGLGDRFADRESMDYLGRFIGRTPIYDDMFYILK